MGSFQRRSSGYDKIFMPGHFHLRTFWITSIYHIGQPDGSTMCYFLDDLYEFTYHLVSIWMRKSFHWEEVIIFSRTAKENFVDYMQVTPWFLCAFPPCFSHYVSTVSVRISEGLVCKNWGSMCGDRPHVTVWLLLSALESGTHRWKRLANQGVCIRRLTFATDSESWGYFAVCCRLLVEDSSALRNHWEMAAKTRQGQREVMNVEIQ